MFEPVFKGNSSIFRPYEGTVSVDQKAHMGDHGTALAWHARIDNSEIDSNLRSGDWYPWQFLGNLRSLCTKGDYSMIVVFASKNPAKVAAVKKYISSQMKGEVELVCLDVDSNVSPTPFSNEECLLGARNRILAAKQVNAGADLYVGAEGGVFPLGEHLMLGGWVVIQDKNGDEFIGSSCFIQLPKSITDTLSPQQRLSEVVESSSLVKDSNLPIDELGTNGIITKGVYTRVMEFEDALKVAFAQMDF